MIMIKPVYEVLLLIQTLMSAGCGNRCAEGSTTRLVSISVVHFTDVDSVSDKIPRLCH